MADIKLSDLYKLIAEGNIEKAKEAIKQKDAYSGEEVCEVLEEIVQQQKDSNEQITSIRKFIEYLGREIVPTEEIANSYHFWLGKAFKDCSIVFLAQGIDTLYEKEVSKQPREKRQELLAKAIYEAYPIKDSDAAWEVSHRIAREYLMQERIRRMLTFNYAAGKEFLEKELEGKDFEKIEEEIKQKVKKLNIQIPKNYDEMFILDNKARYFEEKGDLKKAYDLHYIIQQADPELLRICFNPPFPLMSFCKKQNIRDHRILDGFDQKLKQTYELKNDAQRTNRLLDFYEYRILAYDFLSMKEEAEKDRQARKELLEKI